MFRVSILIYVATLLHNTQQIPMQQAQPVIQHQTQNPQVPAGQFQQFQQQQAQRMQQQLPIMQQGAQQQQMLQQVQQLANMQQQQLLPQRQAINGFQVPELSQAQMQQFPQNQQLLPASPGISPPTFPASLPMTATMLQNQNAMLAPNVQYVEGAPMPSMSPGGVSQVIDLSNINAKEVTALIDNGELPNESVLSAIFSAPAKLGEALPQEIRDLKIHLLDRMKKHKGLLMKAMQTRQDAVVKEIADMISGEGDAEEKEKESSTEKVDDPLYERVPKLPLTVGFDPFLQKPKPSFFGRTRDWFSGWFGGESKPDTNVGNFLDNRRGPYNSFEREGSGWGRSTVYYAPLKYSSHLIPTASGAMDLKTYDFRPYKNGHPRITKTRIITRIIVRKNDSPTVHVPPKPPHAKRGE